MELRKVIRGILAILPIITLCSVTGYALYSLANMEVGEGAFAIIKDIAIFSLGALSSASASASGFYFKQDKDEE